MTDFNARADAERNAQRAAQAAEAVRQAERANRIATWRPRVNVMADLCIRDGGNAAKLMNVGYLSGTTGYLLEHSDGKTFYFKRHDRTLYFADRYGGEQRPSDYEPLAERMNDEVLVEFLVRYAFTWPTSAEHPADRPVLLETHLRDADELAELGNPDWLHWPPGWWNSVSQSEQEDLVRKLVIEWEYIGIAFSKCPIDERYARLGKLNTLLAQGLARGHVGSEATTRINYRQKVVSGSMTRGSEIPTKTW